MTNTQRRRTAPFGWAKPQRVKERDQRFLLTRHARMVTHARTRAARSPLGARATATAAKKTAGDSGLSTEERISQRAYELFEARGGEVLKRDLGARIEQFGTVLDRQGPRIHGSGRRRGGVRGRGALGERSGAVIPRRAGGQRATEHR